VGNKKETKKNTLIRILQSLHYSKHAFIYLPHPLQGIVLTPSPFVPHTYPRPALANWAHHAATSAYKFVE